MLKPKVESPGALPAYLSDRPGWLWPALVVEWPLAWLAYALGNWSAVKIFDYLGKFSVLIAVVFYFTESPNRIKQKHYQAWQVINTAQHMGGSGGRIEALSELNADGVPLVGVNLSKAFLQGVSLPSARLLRSDFSEADVRNSNFSSADLSYASLNGANFRNSDFERATLVAADLADADFCGANFRNADLSDTRLDSADLGNANLSGVNWQKIRSMKKTNLAGVKNPPDGFLTWALRNGAVQLETNPNCPVTPRGS